MASVEQGNFNVSVRGTGVLKPLNFRWVSTGASGRVENILVMAGEKVEEGDLLIQLSNPKLQRELESTRWEIKAIEAENNARYIDMESRYLELETTVLKTKLDFQSAQLKLDAETTLFELGNTTVSYLDFERSKLEVGREFQIWKSQEKRLLKMDKNLNANKKANLARLSLARNEFERIKDQVDGLEVRATTTGTVQKLNLELGKHVIEGEEIAVIASTENLYAQLKIQELQVSSIILGQRVTIDTRNSKIEGKVVRIDPAVIEGEVLIAVSLIGNLPPESRTDLNIDGLIEISNIENTLYLKRPAFSHSFSILYLYRLSDDGSFATKVPVETGQISINYIEVVSGLSKGDRLIVSDTSLWDQHSEILIN